MSAGKENAAIIGVGVVACAACCAGPIIGFLAAIGLGTAAGIALSSVLGVAIAAIGIVRRTPSSATPGERLQHAATGRCRDANRTNPQLSTHQPHTSCDDIVIEAHSSP